MSENLVWLIKNGDLTGLKSAVDKSNFDPNAELLNGRNGLHYAADYGQHNILDYLIKKGANVDKPDKHGITPLLAAIYEDHLECVELLLKNGASKNGKTPGGESYISVAENDKIKALLK